jgi:sugar lactone lactonase YvrE
MRSSLILCVASWLSCLPALPADAGSLLVVSQGTGQVLEYDDSDGSFLGVFVDPITLGFAFPGGLALRPSDGMLYVASTASGEIWTYDTPTGLVSPPETASGLLGPGWMEFDPSGSSLYFLADIPNGPDTDAALRKLTLPGGSISTLASDANASFSALALNGSNVYVSDSFNGEVVRYPTSGGGGGTEISGLVSPGGILFLSATEMLVAETGADRVVEYHDGGSGWIFHREVLSASAGVDGPLGLALAPDGRLTVSGSLSNDAVTVDLDTLAVSPLVAAGAGGLSVAGQIAWSGNTLLIANRSGNSILYYDQSGTPTGIRAQGLTAPADSGFTLSSDGHLLVASESVGNVVEYDAVGGSARTLSNACPLSFTMPFDVAVDSEGSVYVSCGPTDGIRRFDALGIAISFVLPGAGGLSDPRGLAFGPNGNLFVASLSGEVIEFDGATGSFVGKFIDATGNGGGPIDPYGLVFRGGSLYLTSFFPSEVREFDAASGAFIQTLVSSGAGGLSGPTNLAFGPTGDLFVTSQGDDSIKRFDAVSGAFLGTFVASGSAGLDQPFDLAFRAEAPPPVVPALGGTGQLLLWILLAAAGTVHTARSKGPMHTVDR